MATRTKENISSRSPKSRNVRRNTAQRVSLDPGPLPHDLVVQGRKVVEAELAALYSLVPRLGPSFARAVEMILGCKGRLVVSGLGKPGFIAQKISATFASTGTPSLYLHPAEALHGDLGRVTRDDIVLLLSNSGRTEEIVRLMEPLERIGAETIVMTGDILSPLAEKADCILDIGKVEEACPMGLAPTASSTVMLVLGDALAMTVLENRNFGNDDWALYHPAGALGAQVVRVSEVMRQDEANPVIQESSTLAEAVAVMTRTTGRPGATSIVDKRGKLVGIFTDGDLRRLFEAGEADPERPIREVMGKDPRTVTGEMLLPEAAKVLRDAHVDQVPVVDGKNKVIGLLDVQDLLDRKAL